MDATLKSDEHIGDKINRFIDHLPRGDDETLVILKGHLLIEELLRELLAMSVSDVLALERAKLTFFQCVCLCEAIHNEDIEKWVWKAALKLNSLRNRIAHNIEPIGVHDIKADFIDFVCDSTNRHNEIKIAMPGQELLLAIGQVHQFLAILWHKVTNGHNKGS